MKRTIADGNISVSTVHLPFHSESTGNGTLAVVLKGIIVLIAETISNYSVPIVLSVHLSIIGPQAEGQKIRVSNCLISRL